MVENKLYNQWSSMWMPFEYWIAYHLNAEQMDTILFSYVLVQYKNDGSNTFDKAHRPTIWMPDHLKYKVQKVWYYKCSFSFSGSCIILAAF